MISLLAQEEKWKPNKEDCDNLRSQYPEAFKNPGQSFTTKSDAELAATVRTGAETYKYNHEHMSAVYRTDSGFAYSSPVKTSRPTGGTARISIFGVTQNDIVSYAHSHDIGLPAYQAAYPGATAETYAKYGEVFSGTDGMLVWTQGKPLTLHTPSNDLRILRRVDSRPKFGQTYAGSSMFLVPPQDKVDQIKQCIAAGK